MEFSFRSIRARALLVAWALAAFASPGVAGGPGVAAVGAPAPKFLLETPAGGDLTLRAFAGKPLVMNVFASWCPPCLAELPLIVASARRHRARIAFLGVDAQESAQIATSFAKRMRLPYPIALDHGQFAASYGVISLPITVFVDARGTVRAIQHGALDAATLERDLATISARKRAVSSAS